MTSPAEIADTGARILAAVRTVVVGMDDPVEIALATILAGGHVPVSYTHLRAHET